MNQPAAGALLLALAVALGAFGAHGLKDRLDAYSTGIWEKAVFYHFIHALGLVVVPLLARSGMIEPSQGGRVCLLLLAGIVLFSGSLYVLALSGVPVLGAVTPFGGLSVIAAWLLLAYALFQKS
ncbi:MAG: DUF423 domain-containing protein [Acidimicrobiia bacterium]|nr:DUF423 domain-containing protein [Acidimicrobiia bacterium]